MNISLLVFLLTFHCNINGMKYDHYKRGLSSWEFVNTGPYFTGALSYLLPEVFFQVDY